MRTRIAFVMVVALVPVVAAATAAPQPPVSPTQRVVDASWPPAGVVRTGPEIVSPRLIKETQPRYTREAMDAKIQGDLMIEVVVRPDGTVGDVRVVRSLDRKYGLDDEAVKAVKKWLFAPGKKDGVAVPVLVEVEVTFTLK